MSDTISHHFKRTFGNFQAYLLKLQLTKSFSVYSFAIKTTLSDRYLEQSQRLRFEVYCTEYKYIDGSRFNNGMETDEYDNNSIHLVVINNKIDRVVGTIRLVKEDFRGLPMDKEYNNTNNTENTGAGRVEISRLAVDKRYRNSKTKNHGVLLLLLKNVYRYCKKESIDVVFAAIDSNVFKLLKSVGFSFEVIGKPKYYMGSETIPVRINIPHEIEWLRIVNPVIWSFLNSKD